VRKEIKQFGAGRAGRRAAFQISYGVFGGHWTSGLSGCALGVCGILGPRRETLGAQVLRCQTETLIRAEIVRIFEELQNVVDK